ncbi:MAG: sigma-70 family RNA polymerase sigma factor [Flavobacteriales bacterium]|nr:sigma-70 family RNA polymerase sigma factor [Flavobacteriales bacterium]
MNSDSANLQALIDGCKNGDKVCQRKVYEQLYNQMLGVSLRYMGNMDDAKDVLHEGFIKVFTNMNKYSDDGSFIGWVKKIISNTAIDEIRRLSNSKTRTDSDLIENKSFELEEENYNWFEDNNVTPDRIQEEIQNLSPAYRTVFNMYVIEGYTHIEIADYLNISVGASKSNLSKAKARLKETLTNLIEKVNS